MSLNVHSTLSKPNLEIIENGYGLGNKYELEPQVIILYSRKGPGPTSKYLQMHTHF